MLKQKVLVIGANGLLGQKLVDTFLNDFEVHGIGRKNKPSLEFDNFNYTVCDITNREQILDLVRTFEPNFIVNSAAYTNVDGCEDEKEECWKINVVGVENLANVAKRFGIHVVHISTDYVFDGVEGNYDEESRPKPLGYYGRTKLASENVLISSGIVAGAGSLDLDHVGAEVREHRGGEGSRHNAGEIEDADAFEHASRHGGAA